MDKQLKEKLRFFKLSSLYILHTLALTDSIALEVNEISNSTNTSEPELKGVITVLRRVKVNEEPLIVPAGRDDEGKLRWRINESVVSKQELAKFLEEEILGKEGLRIGRKDI